LRRGSNRWNDNCLREGINNREVSSALEDLGVSLNCYRNRLLNSMFGMGFVGDSAISLKDHYQSFFEIAFSFGQSMPLSIDAGDFFDVSDIPLTTFHVYSSELSDHDGTSIT